MLSSSTVFWGQHQCTSTSTKECNFRCMYQNEAWLLQVAVEAVLTAFYKDIKGVQEATGSSCNKIKIVKHWFEEKEDPGTTPKDKACIEDTGCSATMLAAGVAAATGAATPPTGTAEAAPPQAGRSLQLLLLLTNGWCRLNLCAWTCIGVTPGSSRKAGGLGIKKTNGWCRLN